MCLGICVVTHKVENSMSPNLPRKQLILYYSTSSVADLLLISCWSVVFTQSNTTIQSMLYPILIPLNRELFNFARTQTISAHTRLGGERFDRSGWSSVMPFVKTNQKKLAISLNSTEKWIRPWKLFLIWKFWGWGSSAHTSLRCILNPQTPFDTQGLAQFSPLIATVFPLHHPLEIDTIYDWSKPKCTCPEHGLFLMASSQHSSFQP